MVPMTAAVIARRFLFMSEPTHSALHRQRDKISLPSPGPAFANSLGKRSRPPWRLRPAAKGRRSPKDISAEKRQELLAGEGEEISYVQDHINRAVTRYWVHKANSLMLPVADPSDKNYWQRPRLGCWDLTPTYLATLRSSVRKEQKERWELWQMRLGLLIGTIGALIGLISVLKK